MPCKNLHTVQFQKKTCVLKKPNPLVFWFYWLWGFIGFSNFLFERADGKLFG